MSVFKNTIWGPHQLDHVDERYRPLVQVAYPGIYAINVVAYGLVGTATGGSSILQTALPVPGANILCAIIGLAALVALLGVVFGGGKRTFRGQQVERFGAIAMIPPTITYFVLLVVALGGGSSAPLAAMVGTGIVIMFGLLRGLDLSSEIGKADKRRSGQWR